MGLLKPDNLEDIARIQVCEKFGVIPGINNYPEKLLEHKNFGGFRMENL